MSNEVKYKSTKIRHELAERCTENLTHPAVSPNYRSFSDYVEKALIFYNKHEVEPEIKEWVELNRTDD